MSQLWPHAKQWFCLWYNCCWRTMPGHAAWLRQVRVQDKVHMKLSLFIKWPRVVPVLTALLASSRVHGHTRSAPFNTCMLWVHKTCWLYRLNACCRFPLQLELLAPEEIPSQIMGPSEFRCPANVAYLYEQGKDIQEVSWALLWTESSLRVWTDSVLSWTVCSEGRCPDYLCSSARTVTAFPHALCTEFGECSVVQPMWCTCMTRARTSRR